MSYSFEIEPEEKRCISGNTLFFPVHRTNFYFPHRNPLQQERDYGYDHEDYHEPFCNFHGEPGYPPCTQDKENESEYKKNYRQINQISHDSPHPYFFFNFETALCAAIFASETAL